MDKKKYRRVNFRISHCSSEDPDYPVSELLLQSPNAKGWQSKRFCNYPQSIVYELVEPTIIKQISVLSHQSKISTKVVIHNKLEQNKEWSRLGYLSLQSNVNSNYQARELKTVNIHDKPSMYLRFSFEANYVNNHNVFNQVGIISLCVFGDKMVGASDPERPLQQQLGGQFDKHTIAKLKNLQIEKKAALEDEDYDRAQKIKEQIERIKNLGNTLMMLEEKKKKAVQNQDYQAAKIINQKIKKLRDTEGGGAPNFSTRPSGTPSEYYRPKKTIYDDDPPQQNQPSISPMTYQKPQQQPPPIRNRSPPRKIDDDERPINVKTQNPYETAQDQQPQQFTNNEPGGVQPLSKQIRAQCMSYFSVISEQIFMYLFSAHHANRERGLNMLKDEIMGGNYNKQQMAEAFLYVVKKLIDDKNVSVLLGTLDLFAMGMKKLKPPQGNPFLGYVQFILEKMNDYLGHTNEKVRKVTEDIYVSLPTNPLSNKDVCYNALTIIGKRDKPPKILVGRLKALEMIVGNFQLGKNYEGVIKFAIKYADDKNSEVRNAAINLIIMISNEIGYASMQPFLKNLRPQILKTIEQKFNQQGGRDDRAYQQQPLPTQKKKAQRIPIKQARQQFEEAENQFIDVPKAKNVTNSEYVCDFCGRFDKKFEDENYRDMHLFNACPMLMICDECKQAVEINTYTAHQIGECKNSKFFKRCPRCKQAVHQRQYKAHVERKQCIPAKPMAVANRCPLCHLDIDPGQDGWKQHLVEEGCENNPRK